MIMMIILFSCIVLLGIFLKIIFRIAKTFLKATALVIGLVLVIAAVLLLL